MRNDCLEKFNFQDTGFSYTLSLISGKYKMVILYCVMEFNVIRYNELKRSIGTISDKTLSLSLKELEADELIIRKEYPPVSYTHLKCMITFMKDFMKVSSFQQ